MPQTMVVGNLLTSEENMLIKWKGYFEELMNKEIEKEMRVEKVVTLRQELGKVNKDEVRKALKKMKNENSSWL